MDSIPCSQSVSISSRSSANGAQANGRCRKPTVNSHLPVGQLAEYLGALSRERIWFAIVIATGAVGTLDHALPMVGFAILYMPIVCGASWALGAREGHFVALIAAFLAVMPGLRSGSSTDPEVFALGVAVRIATSLFLSGAVASFRRSYDREQFHAHRDRMTGTLNKEVFQQRCAAAIHDAVRTAQALLLVILDLDDFKAVNNSRGHQTGDEVLMTFVEGVSSIMRREDLVGRIGGDEFSLLVRVPSIAEGQGLAHDIHARLSAILAASRYPVTCSMGALLIPAHAPRDIAQLMHEADQAMYRAKQAGKNAFVVARAGGPNTPMIGRLAGQCRKRLA